MARFDFIDTGIDGLHAVQRRPIRDERGFLERLYCIDEFEQVVGDQPIRQMNSTLTRAAGTLRGLHFQYPPKAEIKIVSCLRGSVYDVAVDLRRGSPTYLRWHGRVLSAENHESLIIPKGFAHGLQTLEPDCELLYLHTESYSPGLEGGLDALDARIAIEWPLPASVRSEKDKAWPGAEGFEGIDL